MIEIWLNEGRPPAGRVVTAPGEEPQEFDGWLQLLHILGEIVMQEPSAGQPRIVPLGEGGAD